MKLNLNTHILDSKSYLTYIYENNQLKHVEFDKHIEQNKSRWSIIYDKILLLSEYEIDMYPYFYTLDIIDDKEKQAFLRFFCTYIDRTNNDHSKFIDYAAYLNDLVGSSFENIALFIIAMQYFFL